MNEFPDMFHYLEYREFLRDYYEAGKERQGFFTVRYMGMKTGLDASFLVKVMNKQLHLSEKSLPAVCAFLKLNKARADYFKTLVHFNKAKSRDQAQLYFEKLSRLHTTDAMVVERSRYRYFSEWYIIAVRELLNIVDFRGDFQALSRLFIEDVSPAQARKAVELLVKLGLIQTASDGTYTLTNKNISAGEHWQSIAIRALQKTMINLAEKALDGIPKEKRDISCMTVSASEETLELIRDRIRDMRREIAEILKSDAHPENVYQINFQVFPLTNRGKGGEV